MHKKCENILYISGNTAHKIMYILCQVDFYFENL